MVTGRVEDPNPDNVRSDTGGSTYITSGAGVREFYTDIKLYPRNFSIKSILLQQSHHPEYVILTAEISFSNPMSVRVSLLVHS